mmetsp:Transcript_44395/g.123460  ORF Transcript_44395/g.123460 Transcript_44395/m.123460 type:complete len:228 (-) Transcript_44395:525-1208(-)
MVADIFGAFRRPQTRLRRSRRDRWRAGGLHSGQHGWCRRGRHGRRHSRRHGRRLGRRRGRRRGRDHRGRRCCRWRRGRGGEQPLHRVGPAIVVRRGPQEGAAVLGEGPRDTLQYRGRLGAVHVAARGGAVGDAKPEHDLARIPAEDAVHQVAHVRHGPSEVARGPGRSVVILWQQVVHARGDLLEDVEVPLAGNDVSVHGCVGEDLASWQRAPEPGRQGLQELVGLV